MRRVSGLFVAFALVLPIGVTFATPAGAGTGAGCKAISGTATFKPGLPPITSKATVNSTVTINTKLTGCTGAGGASGSTSSTAKLTKVNCANFENSKTASKPAVQHVVWAKGQTSTASATIKSNGKFLQSNLTSKTTAGLYAGTTTTGVLQATLPTGACTAKPLTTLPFKTIGKLVTK